METKQLKKEKNPIEFFIGLLTGEGVFSQTHLLFEKMKKKELGRKVK